MIETERLILRQHIAEDFPAYKSMAQDAEVMRYIGRKPSTEDEAWLGFLAFAGRWKFTGYGLFAVFEKQSGQFLGNAGFSDFKRNLGIDFDPFHEAAWMFKTDAQGKGYAFEATSAAHDWLDEKYKPDKTVCIISPENKASIKLATKLGYTEYRCDEFKDSPVILFERRRV